MRAEGNLNEKGNRIKRGNRSMRTTVSENIYAIKPIFDNDFGVMAIQNPQRYMLASTEIESFSNTGSP